MAGGEGLLEAAQQQASLIPYKNIALAQNSANMFTNAFYKAAEISGQRQKLENQLINLETNSRLREQQQELNLTKMQMDYGFKTQDLNRKYDQMAMTASYQDRISALKEQELKNKFGQVSNLIDRGAQYSDEVAALNQRVTPGTRQWGAEYQNIHTKYQDFLQTAQGQRLDNDNMQYHKQGAMQMHRDAGEAKDKFYANLAAIGKSKEFNLDDFTVGKWGTNPDGSKWIATDKTTGARLSPEEVKATNSKNVNFHTIDPTNYKLFKSMSGSVMKYASGDPTSQPDVITSGKPIDKPTAREFYRQAGGDKQKAMQLAQDAGYDF